MEVLGNEEQLEQRFKDFKDEILRAITALSDRVSELSGEVKAYMQMAQQQDRQLVDHAARLKELEKDTACLGDDNRRFTQKIGEVERKQTELETDIKTTQRNMKTTITVVSLVITAVNFIIQFWPK